MGLRHPCAHRTASARSAVEPYRRSALNRNFAIPTGVPIRETMRRPQKLLHPFLLVFAYAAISAVMGIVLAEATLHPAKRALMAQNEAWLLNITKDNLAFEAVSINANDGIQLRAWRVYPKNQVVDAVILLHGMGDDRSGMTGYAELLLKQGYSVLLPDARAHGASGGELATYGLLERDDIRRWFEWLELNQSPPCIFALGESMGAAQLLQSLEMEPGFCALVAESSFSTFREIAYDRVGQFFQTGPWLGRSILWPVVEAAFQYSQWKYGLETAKISPEDAVAKSQVHILLIHGALDGNIPPRHSRRIQARNKSVVLWEVPKADHGGAISTAHDEFEARLISWFAVHSSRPCDQSLSLQKCFVLKARSPKLEAVPFTSTKPHPHPQSAASAESSARLHRQASISKLR
jgi:pimeloyl-ACP methyl ester carboxylesterase